jgi:hypothetical protein
MVRQILAATFGSVEADLAAERERGRLGHVAPDGRRTYVKRDGDTAVITMTRAGRDELRSEIVGVDLADLT